MNVHGIEVRVLALRVICHACSASAQLVVDDYNRRTQGGALFFDAHYAPEIIAADVRVGGETRIYPVRGGHRCR